MTPLNTTWRRPTRQRFGRLRAVSEFPAAGEGGTARPDPSQGTGEITPGALQAGVKATQGGRSRATGRDDFQDLADPAEVVMQKAKSSGNR